MSAHQEQKDRIFLVGPMAVGKSSVGRALAAALSYSFVDSDHEIESRTGADIGWIFDVEGEDGFRKREREVIEELSLLSNTVLATGGGAILNPETRSILRERGYVVYLTAPLEILVERTIYDKKRPMLQQADKEAVLRNVLKQRSPLYEEIADFQASTAADPVKELAGRIAAHFSGTNDCEL